MANIVVCADGTWNRPEEDIEKDFPTNVLKLARAISPSTSALKQQVFYDWGLGSYHDRVSAGATGRGIHKNILDGYRYIVQNYAEGDRIYLFGFSRGAYTVRALSGLINNCGILKRPQAALISSAWKIYKSPQKKNHPDGDAAVQFRNAHAHPSRAVHFIGVWDTVGALGLPFSFMGLFERHDEFYDTKMGPNVAYARHALAIDEQRDALVNKGEDAQAVSARACMARALALARLAGVAPALAARAGAEQCAAQQAERRLDLRRLATSKARLLVER